MPASMRSKLTLGIIVLTSWVGACEDRESSLQTITQPSLSLQTSVSWDSTFYYYEGQKIRLEPALDAVIFDIDAPDLGASVQVALQANGVAPAQLEAIPWLPGHWIARLSGADASAQERAASAIRALPQVRFAQPSYRLPGTTTSFIPTNRVSVQFKRSTTQPQIDSIAASLGLQLIRPPHPDSGFFEHAYQYPREPGVRPLAIAALLDRHPLVLWANPTRISNVQRAFVPSDPYYYLQFHLKNTIFYNGSRVDINAEPAWDVTKGSSAIKLAVIDDGIDIEHQDYGIGPGFVGALGYDPMAVPGQPDHAFNPYGADSHGTHIAGLIWAEHNTQGVSGIAPFVIARVGRIFRGDAVATDAQIAEVINWAWQFAASDVISNSWGGGAPSQAITNAINNARTLGRGGKGTVVVFAAGNNNASVNYPANLSGVIAVGAITKNGPRAAYSNFGSELDLVAPSSPSPIRCEGDVVTTDLWGTPGCNDGPSGGALNYTSTFGGTSAATAEVAAVAALLLSARPQLYEWQVRNRLCLAAIPWGSASEYGCGKLDAYRAVAPSPTVTVSGPSSVRPGWTCLWTASPIGGVAPYTYAWWVNNAPVSESSNQLTFTNAGSNFTVKVQAVDWVGGASNVATKSVTVSPSAPACQF